AEGPHREPCVLEGRVEPASSPRVATFLLDLFDAAELQQRRTTGVFRRHPRVDVLSDLSIDMEPQFLVERGFHLGSTNQVPQATADSEDHAHGMPPQAMLTTTWIADESRRHCATSASRRLRPALVSV